MILEYIKTTKKMVLALFIMATSTSFAQIGIGTDSPASSAAIELQSTSQGFLPPRMTKTQMQTITSPAQGLMLNCNNCSPIGLYLYDGNTFLSAKTGEETTPSNTGLGSSFTITGSNGEAFSSNATCASNNISATICTDNELANGIGYDPDGEGYTVVQIEDSTSGYAQCWMAENIQTGEGPSNTWENYTDKGWYGYLGDIDQTPDTPPTTDGDGTTGSALAYNEKEGLIYQWSAAMDGETAERSQGICPSGWHIPSDCEWMFLENNLGMSITDQEVTSWRGTNQGTKLLEGGDSNFEGIHTGYRNGNNGSFTNRNTHVYYWSSTTNEISVYVRHLFWGTGNVYRSPLSPTFTISVRCLKD